MCFFKDPRRSKKGPDRAKEEGAQGKGKEEVRRGVHIRRREQGQEGKGYAEKGGRQEERGVQRGQEIRAEIRGAEERRA